MCFCYVVVVVALLFERGKGSTVSNMQSRYGIRSNFNDTKTWLLTHCESYHISVGERSHMVE